MAITEQTTGDGGVPIQAVEDLTERLQPVAELHHLSPEDRVLGLHSRMMPCGEGQGCQDPAVLLPQLVQLRRQIVQMFLLAHPRPPRGLAVGYHSLLPLLVHQCLQILFGA
ncbi:unnamed protein product [Musa hybrid cultivar]